MLQATGLSVEDLEKVRTIRERSRMLGYAIDARRQRFPDERPYVYRPFVDEGLSYTWDDAARGRAEILRRRPCAVQPAARRPATDGRRDWGRSPAPGS